MTQGNASDPNDKELLDRICWLIRRSDDMRYSTSQRSSMVLSANTLLFVFFTFVTDKVLTNKVYSTLIFSRISDVKLFLLFYTVAIYLVFSMLSIYSSMKSVINIRSTNSFFHANIPIRLFFNSSDTFRRFTEYKSFRDAFLNTPQEKMIDFALRELLTGIYQYHYRHEKLRGAVIQLVISLFALYVNIMVLIVSLFI